MKAGLKSYQYLVYPPILNAVNYFLGIMATPWCSKDGSTTLMDIIHNLRSQSNCISSIETFVSSLKIPSTSVIIEATSM